MTTLEVLVAAREKIGEGWTQEGSAILEDGMPTIPPDPCAVAHCTSGAVLAVTSKELERYSALKALRWLIPCGYMKGSLENWNDTLGRTKAEVLALYNCAIVLVESTGQKGEVT